QHPTPLPAQIRSLYRRSELSQYRDTLPVRAYVFFFQAEDGIRDRNVTGVQTCALPIFILGRKKAGDLFQISCSVCRCVGGWYLVVRVRGKLTRCKANKLKFPSLHCPDSSLCGSCFVGYPSF